MGGLKGGKAEVKQQPPPWGSAWVLGCGSPHLSQLLWQFTFSVQGATTSPAEPPAPVRPPLSATPAPGPGVCASPWQRVPSTSADNPHCPGWSYEGQTQVPRGPSKPSPTSQWAFLPDWTMVISGPPQTLHQSFNPCHSQLSCFSGQTLTDSNKKWWSWNQTHAKFHIYLSSFRFLFFFWQHHMAVQNFSFLTRDQTHAPCSGSSEPNHWTTMEVPQILKDKYHKKYLIWSIKWS